MFGNNHKGYLLFCVRQHTYANMWDRNRIFHYYYGKILLAISNFLAYFVYFSQLVFVELNRN